MPGAGDTPSHTATPAPTTTTGNILHLPIKDILAKIIIITFSAVDIENKKIVRPRTPIIEDPNESRSPSPNPPAGAVPPVSAAPSSQPTLSPNTATTVPKSDSATPTTSTTVVEEKPEESKDEKPKDDKPKDDKPKHDKPKDDKSKDEKPKEVKSEKPPEKKEALKPPEVAGRPITPTGERGKSKTTGKTISGWL